MDYPAVLGDAHPLTRRDHFSAPQSIVVVREMTVPFRHENVRRAADYLVLGVAEYPLRAGVPGCDSAVERAADDRVVRILHDRRELRAHGLGALALGDVPEHQ